MFDAIGNGDHVAPRDLVGHLLILQPTRYETGVPTVHGDADAVALDLVDLDTDDGTVFRDQRWFNKVILAALRNRVGAVVLARVTVGTAKRPGQDPPYVLVDASTTPGDVARAQAWMAAHPAFTVGAPSTVPAPPVAASPAPAAMVAAHTTTLPAPVPTASTSSGEISPEVAELIRQLQAKG